MPNERIIHHKIRDLKSEIQNQPRITVYSRQGVVLWCFPFNSRERMINFLSSIFIHVFIPRGREWHSAINNRLSVSLDTMKENDDGCQSPVTLDPRKNGGWPRGLETPCSETSCREIRSSPLSFLPCYSISKSRSPE